MREIKFEIIWEDLKEKRHKQIVTLDNLLLGAWELPRDRLTTIARRQYVGLLDKNDKEIYEKDIVRAQAGNFYQEKEEGVEVKVSIEIIGVVNWVEEECRWRVDEIGTSSHWWPTIEKNGRTRFEVLGNIYENPKLLK